MVHACEFARRTCGWKDESQVDPLLFARASDPAVGDEVCPWSDWHDDTKLLDLAGDGARIIRRQPWNDGRFFWYELDWGIALPRLRPFFDSAALEKGTPLLRLGPREFRPSEADVSRGWRRVTARLPASRSDYALVSRTVESPAGANAVVIDLFVADGAVSVGILDVETHQFVSVAIPTGGVRQPMLLLADPLPARFQIVASNHQPVVPAPGEFLMGSACILRRPLAAAPVAQARRP
jgi:hypothetical protein